MWSRALPNAASKKVTSDAGSDGLDALLAECALERSSSTSARSPARAPARPATATAVPPPPPTQQRALTPDECRARDAVVALQQALADAAIAAAVDRTLKSAGAVDTWRYYDDRPELARYTIERELARNTFVVTEDGVEVTDAAARLGALEGDDAYLLRLANQSLFGDCLVALGSALDASGAQAAVSNTAAGATYHVALGREASLEGRLRVTVNVPSSTESGRLALGDARRRRDGEAAAGALADGVDRPRGDGQGCLRRRHPPRGNRDRLAHGGAAGRSLRRPRRTPRSSARDASCRRRAPRRRASSTPSRRGPPRRRRPSPTCPARPRTARRPRSRRSPICSARPRTARPARRRRRRRRSGPCRTSSARRRVDGQPVYVLRLMDAHCSTT